jgi:hypothetical protein
LPRDGALAYAQPSSGEPSSSDDDTAEFLTGRGLY